MLSFPSKLMENVGKEKSSMKRKDFLKIAAAGAAVGLGQLVLSACKNSTPTTPSTSFPNGTPPGNRS
jgi:hypothetical protein